MGSADVNWLLSASVQSGAALVAIVGGLLGSRYVALDSERQAALRRLGDAEAGLVTAAVVAEAAGDAWSAFRVAELLDTDEVYAEVSAALRRRSEPTVEGVLEAADLRDAGVPLAELTEHLAFVTQQMRAAVERLSVMVPEQERLPMWEAFRRDRRLDPAHDSVWGWVYDKVADAKEDAAWEARREREAEERRRRRASAAFSIAMPDPMASIRQPSMRSLGAVHGGRGIGGREKLVRDRDDAERVVAHHEAEVEAARAHLRSTGQPQGFALAIQVLAYIAVTTIAFPLAVMVWTPLTLPWWLRVAVAVAFLSGVGLLVRYLFVYAAVLRDPRPATELPSSLVGLLRPWRDRDPG